MKIAFYKGTHKGLYGIFNRLVRWWTRGPYSHAELIFAEPQHSKAHLCFTSSFLDGGVRGKLIELDEAKWDVVELNSENFNAARAYAWFQINLGLKYDVMGIFGAVVRSVEDDRDKYFCSEAIAAALGLSEPWRYDPNTLYAALKKSTETDKLSKEI